MKDSKIGSLIGRLRQDPPGMHVFHDPGYLMDSEFPDALKQCLYETNGASLYFEAITFFSSKEIKRNEENYWHIGHYNQDVFCDAKGKVYTKEDELYIQEAQDVVSFFYGATDAESTLYDKGGEFKEGIFDDGGELLPSHAIVYEKKKIDRDRHAIGPMWRLASLFAIEGRDQEAQALLEDCVEDSPGFYWAWHDLSELSANQEKFELAIDELLEAISQTNNGSLRAHFYSKAALHASKLNDEAKRKEFAGKTLEHDKDFVNQLIESIKEEHADGADIDFSRTSDLLLAVAPRNLMVLDFVKKHRDKKRQSSD